MINKELMTVVGRNQIDEFGIQLRGREIMYAYKVLVYQVWGTKV